MPAVSVTLPCYNAEATLPACLDSLLAQEGVDFEIVAADDGSTDRTGEIIEEYSHWDERVRPLSLPHGGVARAAMAAIDASRGRYVARMDADDLALPGRLEAQAAHLDAHPGTGLVGCRVRFGGSRAKARGYSHYVDWTNAQRTAGAISLNRFVELPVPNPSIMFRRELVERYGGYEQGDFPEDYDMLLRWLEAGVVMEKVDRELLVWNDPPTRLTRSDPRYDPEAFYRVKAAYLARWLKRRNPHHPVIRVLGAGRPTRKRAEMLLAHGVAIEAFHDVDPRKVGAVLRGRPVLHRDEVPPPGEAFLVSYVATRGARDDIAAFLASRGYGLGLHWIAAA
ncbi:MAG: glycosyltransferase family 2 protein [Desulfovibrionaceae bacterium]